MLLERGCKVVSVEPNDTMREIGIERTKGEKIEWIRATGLNSTLLKNVSIKYTTCCWGAKKYNKEKNGGVKF